MTTRWLGFKVVDLREAREITGLTLEELRKIPGAEEMTRIQGRSQVQAVRIPAEVLEAAVQNREAVAAALADYRSGGSDSELRARIREIIDADTGPAAST